MAGLSDQVIKKEIKVEPKKVKTKVEDKFELTKDELKFILAKIAQVEFKGVEIEFTYNLIIKLQEHYKYLSKTQ
jgi:predicted transcriptional regulator|tara:strand:- start:38 stop:259 length:222 start_codon:yes stop_codon:yes gene_type:complete